MCTFVAAVVAGGPGVVMRSGSSCGSGGGAVGTVGDGPVEDGSFCYGLWGGSELPRRSCVPGAAAETDHGRTVRPGACSAVGCPAARCVVCPGDSGPWSSPLHHGGKNPTPLGD